MEKWLELFHNPDGLTPALFLASFILGFLGTVTSCCNFAIIGAVAGYSGTLNFNRNRKKLILVNLSFFLGIFISFIIIGLVIGFAGQQIADAIGPYWKLLTGSILIFAGIISFGIIKIKSPSLSPGTENPGSGIIASVIFGLTIGGASTVCTACCNPVFPVILGASFLQQNYFQGVIVIILFSLGYSLPFLALLTGLGLGFDKLRMRLNKYNIYIRYITGAIMTAIGFYFLITF